MIAFLTRIAGWIAYGVLSFVIRVSDLIDWAFTFDLIARVNAHFTALWLAIKSGKMFLFMAIVQGFVNTYIFSEWNFALGFFFIFLIDTWSGIYIAWRQKRFSSTILRTKLMDKTVAYFSIIIAWSIGTKILLNDSQEGILHYLDLGFYNIFVVAELFSIIKNWYEFKRWPVLARLMKHFKGFDPETGEPNEHTQATSH